MKRLMLVLSIAAGALAVLVAVLNVVAWNRIDADKNRSRTEAARAASLEKRKKPDAGQADIPGPTAGSAENENPVK